MTTTVLLEFDIPVLKNRDRLFKCLKHEWSALSDVSSPPISRAAVNQKTRETN